MRNKLTFFSTPVPVTAIALIFQLINTEGGSQLRYVRYEESLRLRSSLYMGYFYSPAYLDDEQRAHSDRDPVDDMDSFDKLEPIQHLVTCLQYDPALN